jgi:polyadenylate-binding protein 2
MEEEQKKLLEMQGEVDKELQSAPKSSKNEPGSSSYPTPEEKLESDTKSVYVGNVDYSATAEELGKHFEGCGPVNRVTIMCDKYSGNPKGFAYIEFMEKDSVDNALKLDESLFKGRQLKVKAKRTNRPGLSTTARGSRFRGRGRGYSRGGYFYPMFLPMPVRGRGRAMRRSRSNWYAPY